MDAPLKVDYPTDDDSDDNAGFSIKVNTITHNNYIGTWTGWFNKWIWERWWCDLQREWIIKTILLRVEDQRIRERTKRRD